MRIEKLCSSLSGFASLYARSGQEQTAEALDRLARALGKSKARPLTDLPQIVGRLGSARIVESSKVPSDEQAWER